MTTDALTEANRLQREGADPDRSAWVSASAGSGKTKLLVDRVLRLLLSGVAPDKILCLTYTRAAAAQMANRVAEELGEWASCSDAALDAAFENLLGRQPASPVRRLARQLFARVLDVPGGLRIMTIHAFCQSLLRRFPLEAGVAPQFQLIEERDAAQMLRESEQAALLRAAAKPDSALGRAVSTVTARIAESEFDELMMQLRGKESRLRGHIDAEGGIAAAMRNLRARLGVAKGDSETSLRDAACAERAFDGAALRLACAALLEGKTSDTTAGERMRDWLGGDPDHRAATFDEYALAFLTDKNAVRARLATKGVQAALPGIIETMTAEADRIAALRARCAAIRLADATEALLVLGEAVFDGYRTRKALMAALDYDDLIERARLLLKDEGAAWVHYKLDGGIDHVLVDEAQDTSPAQWQIVQALTGEFFAGAGVEREAGARTIFAVGDRKQSIFSFQGADPDAFEQMRDWFAGRIREASEPMRIVPLAVSFRSVEAVLDAVDNVFSNPAAADGVVEADIGQLEHRATRTGQAGRVELWPLVTRREVADPEPWAPPVDRFPADSPRERLARGVAAHIAALVTSGEALDSHARPVQPGDVLVLVRRRNAFLSALVRELKEREIAVAGIDRMNLGDQLAVMDLLVLAEFLLHPEDDLSLATVLRGPFGGFSDEELFDLAYAREGTLWASLSERRDECPAFARAHRWLAALLAETDYLPPFELFQRALGCADPASPTMSGRRALVARLGFDAADPVDEFLALALEYDRRHAPSLQGFLAWFAASDTEVKRDLDQGTRDQVRIMTVHGAKGLQAPIVYLPDTTSLPQDKERLLWMEGSGRDGFLWAPRRDDEEGTARGRRGALAAAREAEHRRLLYVAMTRAEDRLYVAGWQDRKKVPDRSWYRLIEAGLAESAKPFAFDNRSLFRHPDEGWTGEGLVRDVARDRNVTPDRIEPAIPAPLPMVLPDWASAPAPSERQPIRPVAPSRPSGDPAPRSPLGADGGTLFRRGLVVHRLLELLPNLPPDDRRAAGAALLADPAHRLDVATQVSLLDEVMAILDAPALAWLFADGSLAEAPMVGEIATASGERVAISGQVDRLAISADRVAIVDYKTLRPVPPSVGDAPAPYLRQLAAYRQLAGAIWPDRPIECWLLWTEGPLLMKIPDAMLADAGA
jgi:ATP-dependent helicase/nuclease subunit A